jgi:hypothetical protein
MTIQDEITAQTLKTVKQAQDLTLDAIHTVAERVSPLIPKADSIPFLTNLPTPSEVVAKAFDLSSVLLASAKNVAVEATKAFTPQAAKPAPKPTTPKAAAKAAAETSASTN